MLASGIPTKFPIPWANSAGSPTYVRAIPTASQIGIQNDAASLTDGFPPDCFAPGGAPFGADTNGILKQITQWNQWQQAGAAVPWDSAFSAAIGGYPAGAVVAALTFGYFWLCTTDNNTSDPETGGSGWDSFSPLGFTTGDVKATFKVVADPGWIFMNDGTIGSASSGATTRANADTANLYALLWNNISNTYAPVTGGRGASAAADFAANKPMTLPLALGRAMCQSGAGAGLTAYAIGQTAGENTHALLITETPPHTHTYSAVAGGAAIPNGTGLGNTTENTGSTGGAGSSPSGGSGAAVVAHNNVQPSTFFNFMVRL
jgi:microcystin-dependent protein